MNTTDWGRVIVQLKSKGIVFRAGLDDREIERIQQQYGFRFPPDLRSFLQTALPDGRFFPNWRGDEAILRDWLNQPLEGVLFDVEMNSFWLEEWGPRPATLAAAKVRVTELVTAAPKLIPIYQHRMIPDSPELPGNPVFSVHQTDIIVYGTDLMDYFLHEFFMSEAEREEWTIPEGTRAIPFWDTDRFQDVRWGPDGGCAFDNRRGILP